jgi:hypothetical protein
VSVTGATRTVETLRRTSNGFAPVKDAPEYYPATFEIAADLVPSRVALGRQ